MRLVSNLPQHGPQVWYKAYRSVVWPAGEDAQSLASAAGWSSGGAVDMAAAGWQVGSESWPTAFRLQCALGEARIRLGTETCRRSVEGPTERDRCIVHSHSSHISQARGTPPRNSTLPCSCRPRISAQANPTGAEQRNMRAAKGSSHLESRIPEGWSWTSGEREFG